MKVVRDMVHEKPVGGIETADELTSEELAYQRSDVMTWRGQELQPFSYLRKTAAMALMRYFDQNMPEAVVVLWISLQPDINVRKVRRDPASAEIEIDRWSEDQRLLDGVTPEAECQSVYDAIMADIAASMSRPADKDADAEKKRLETGPASRATT